MSPVFVPAGDLDVPAGFSKTGDTLLVLPSYRTIQDMFTDAYSMEDARLDGLISAIPESKKEQLSVLINKEDGITPLNVIRLDQKNFKYKAIMAEVDKALGLAELYEFAKGFLPSLKISKNSIRYYASKSHSVHVFNKNGIMSKFKAS